MRRRRLTMAAVMLVVAFLTTAGSCKDEYNDDRGKGDAPVGDRDDSPAGIINMPNEFPNVVHKCDGAGHRVYVTREGEGTPRQLFVIEDESCA